MNNNNSQLRIHNHKIHNIPYFHPHQSTFNPIVKVKPPVNSLNSPKFSIIITIILIISSSMGKGCGCFPSKNNPPIIIESEFNNNSDSVITDPNSNPILVTDINDDSIPLVTIKNLRIFIVFYSMYGHVESLARNIKKGVDEIDGVEGVLFRVPETLSSDTLFAMKVPEKENDVPEVSVDELLEADGLLFGFPTRYGCMSAQMKAFFDSTSGLWKEQKLAGVPAGFFVSTGTQGGGQETTAWTAITQLAHHGMLYVPIGYTFGAGMFKMDSIRGGSPYGAGVFSGDGTREPSEPELELAQHQGRYMAMIVKRFGPMLTNTSQDT